MGEDEQGIAFDKLDVFGCEDPNDASGGRPLYSDFGHEDWTMMTLRFELHALVHSFRRDVKEADRNKIHIDNLPFYYQKYFKRALIFKIYGVDSVSELLELVKDTVRLRGHKVLEPMLPDLNSLNVFAMITEERRRDRIRRLDLGEEAAKLNVLTPHWKTAANPTPKKPGVPSPKPPLHIQAAPKL